ncbi:Rep [uncultured virus]|jgi:hypothetical protein|uniref:Rep n=1 Tax=uncultured virus TaxID=340016 RepID=A0A2K9LVZ2_9VIRU|nr:Rep [uncultured virus]
MSALINNQTKETQSKPKEFRLNSQQLFLTYSQCPINLELILNHLKSLVEIDKYIVAQEKHQDGNLHIHCYLLLKSKLNLKNPRKFDYQEYHPKVEGCRSYKNVIKYVTKDGNYITNYERDILEKIINDNKKASEIYVEARKLAVEDKVEEGMKILEHAKTARDLCIHGNTIRRNLESLVPKRRKIVFALSDFRIDFEWDRTKTLILWGPTNTGKSSLAKALLPDSLFVSHIDRLRDYNSKSYTGIIFDDMSFKHIPRDGQLHLVDNYDDRDIHCRYAPAFIPAGTPKIITSNNPPSEILLVLDPAIARRVQIVNIEYQVWGNPNPDTTTTTTTTTTTPSRSNSFITPVTTFGGDFEWVKERFRGAPGTPASEDAERPA